MDTKDLLTAKCVPCHGGSPPLTHEQARALLPGAAGWEMSVETPKIARVFRFKDFAAAMQFVNAVAAVAEEQGHHPDIEIHWNKVTLTLWTHAIGGLHENDFVVAARINSLQGG